MRFPSELQGKVSSPRGAETPAPALGFPVQALRGSFHEDPRGKILAELFEKVSQGSCSGNTVRFYAQGAPSWWPFHLVSLHNQRLPPARSNFYYIVIDNGMFGFYKQGARPPLDLWLQKLWAFAMSVERLRKPREIVIVLPDWLGDFDFTLRAAQHPVAKRMCRDYKCMVVAHTSSRYFGVEGAYAYAASIYASLDHIHALAAPLKLNCLRYDSRGRRHIVDSKGLRCQLEIVNQVCSTARRYNLQCHGLGLVLEPTHVRKAVERGLDSFDGTAWTRPNKTVVEKYLSKDRLEKGKVSAVTVSEKELFFMLKLRQLIEAGIVLYYP